MFYLFHVFRSFLPLSNPLGFGASDLVEFAVAAMLVIGLISWNRLAAFARRFAHRTGWCMLLAGGLPVALRLAMLPVAGVPIPSTADDSSYLLLADTLSHFHLANPTHPFYRFFETNFVLQQPTYSSIFPLGQGIALALGRAIFGHPWAGVLLSEAAFCALCYWMLRGWIAPGWALAGGLLAGFEFGPLCSWMNTYWGGAVSGMAGCLVFGALPRLRETARKRDAILLGASLGLQLLTRPYECVFLVAIAAVFLMVHKLRRLAPLVALATLPAVALTLAQNKAVTGNWTTLPYILSRAQYGVPATFTMQPNPLPQRELTEEQQADYWAQVQVHDRESSKSFGERLADRLPYARFFLLPSLLLTIPAFFFARRERHLLWAPAAVAVFALAINFYPYFHPHYLAAIACLFLLMSVIALGRLNPAVSRMMLLLAAGHFVFWYGLHASANPDLLAGLGPFESFDFVNHGDPEGRLPILDRLQREPGEQLVFVRFSPEHPLREWMFNAADIDRARVVWALDLGPQENRTLSDAFPGRRVWMVDPDARPPRLVPLH